MALPMFSVGSALRIVPTPFGDALQKVDDVTVVGYRGLRPPPSLTEVMAQGHPFPEAEAPSQEHFGEAFHIHHVQIRSHLQRV